MNCPRCQVEMKVMKMQDIELDVCASSCGGIWFDQHEFVKLDEVHEGDETFLQELAMSTQPKSFDGKIDCPKCDGVTLMTRFHSPKQATEIDECAACGGIWLDDSELLNIYRTCPTEEAKKEAFSQLFAKQIEPGLSELKNESEQNLKKARRFANMFKYICPSYYIPGKQDGGAF